MNKLRLILMFACGGVFVYGLLAKRVRLADEHDAQQERMAQALERASADDDGWYAETHGSEDVFEVHKRGKEKRFQEKRNRLSTQEAA